MWVTFAAALALVLLLWHVWACFKHYAKVILAIAYMHVAVAGTALPGLLMCRLSHWRNVGIAKFWFQALPPLLGFRMEMRDTHNLQLEPPVVYVGNHQNLLDIITYLLAIPHRTVLLVKRQVFWYGAIGFGFYLMDSVALNRERLGQAIEQLTRAKDDMVRRQISIFGFPEGHRNYENPKDFLPFKKGIFHLAIEGQFPIVPIVNSRYANFYEPGKRFDSGRVLITCLPPIPTKGLTVDDVDELMAKVRAQMLDAFNKMNQELQLS